jgi:ubiquinone biosynthesis protein COQ4
MTPTIFRHPDRPTPRFRPFKALSHFRKLLADKEDTEQVFHIFESLPRKGFVTDAKAFVESARGQHLMQKEPFLPTILDDHATLQKLPQGTVGRAYVDFMTREGLSAAGLVAESKKMESRARDYGDQIGWYVDRLRDTHDLLHVLTGYGRDGLGEQCVLGFTYGQTRNLGNLFIAYLGGFELNRRVKAGAPVMAAIREGQRCGTAAPNIIDEDISELLAEPLEAARKRLKIGAPTQYHRAHEAYRSVGIDPYNFLAAAA